MELKTLPIAIFQQSNVQDSHSTSDGDLKGLNYNNYVYSYLTLCAIYIDSDSERNAESPDHVRYQII